MSDLLKTMMNMPQQISNEEINGLTKARQIYSDCYLVSSLNSLTRTEQGREILKSHIRKINSNDKQGYLIHYNNVKNKSEDVFISSKEIEAMDTALAKKKKHCTDVEDNNLLKAIELSMKKLIKENPSLKNFASRLNPCLENFENNIPSTFLKMLTGKKQVDLNVKTPFLSLRFHKNKTKKLLDDIEKAGDKHHFVAGTSYNFGPHFKNWHCYTITGVDTKQNAVSLYETRKGQYMRVDIDYFIENFKFVSGYFEAA